jgi:hypothetical protein
MKNVSVYSIIMNGGKKGEKEILEVGSRRLVHSGTALATSGGLKKRDLVKNKWGRIVSRKKHITATKEQRLKKHGYTAKKGKFGAVKMKRRKSHKKRD